MKQVIQGQLPSNQTSLLNNILRMIHYILVMVIIASSCYSQDSMFRTSKNRFLKFDHISIEHGLSDVSVNKIFQDSEGFMWFCTDNGLCKYDGITFKTYLHDPSDSLSIQDNIIESIYEDKDGILWIGTLMGWLEKFVRDKEQFVHYKIGSHVYSIAEDKKGNMWLGTLDPGLIKFNKETGELSLIVKGKAFRSFLTDERGNLFGAVSAEGYWIYDSINEIYTKLENSAPLNEIIFGPEGNTFASIINNGLIEVNTELEVINHYQYDAQSSNSLSNNSVTSIILDSDENLWIGTIDGLNFLDYKTKHFSHFTNDPIDQYSLSDNKVLSIYIDHSENLWIGTLNGGLNKASLLYEGFSFFNNEPGNSNSLGNNVVNAICEDRIGNLWIGTDNGLHKLNQTEEMWDHYYYDPNIPSGIGSKIIWSVYEDRSGTLWIGTENGIDKFDQERNTFVHYQNYRTHDMLEDISGNFLVAATEGLYKFEPDDGKFTQLLKGYAWKINLMEDSKGRIWLGTSGDGIELYNPKTDEWLRYDDITNDPTSLSHGFAECILEDKDGNIWIGTGGGFNKFIPETGGFKHYTTKDGLANDYILGLQEDQNGYIWIGTVHGISRFDAETETFKNYATDKKYVNPFRRGAYYQSKVGRIFFGGINGITMFDPSKVIDNQYEPPLVITGLSLFNENIKGNIKHGELYEFSYKENFLSFDFAALDYTNPPLNQYAFKMEGIDNDWNYIGNRTHVDYPDLKPGKYVFLVKGSNNDGVWNTEGTTLYITINPPFWQTWWFRIVVIFIVVTLVFYFYKWRIHQIENKRKELEIRIKEKTEAARNLQNALDEVERLKNRLQTENVYLQDEIKTVHNFENIITKSKNFRKVLQSVEQVSETDAAVLILGESGTGKELVARAIHNISSRSSRPLIKVNCAVLPEHLIESELFGHEKGAFTGAIAQKIGRFELANGGTIFLDEIGELKLDLQAKLLRVLQEGEFERLGNAKSIHVDVRVISATNRNLKKEIENGNFREDLFYRLNVFPINILSLRDRKEDIPLLVKHFVQKYSAKTGKQIEEVSHHILENLKEYSWPGNVRELENIIERAVIISKGKKLILGDWLSKDDVKSQESDIPTLEALEKEHIVKVLEKTRWKVSGESGAAKILGLKRTTLEARMQKLGIRKNK